jgi:hypothetical protein
MINKLYSDNKKLHVIPVIDQEIMQIYSDYKNSNIHECNQSQLKKSD